jgi:hypothetical protein
MDILQQAALQAALQIQADGGGLKVFRFNNAVNVTQASISISQFQEGELDIFQFKSAGGLVL